jgi:DNA-binding transcriptional ArsR family regulator
MTTFIDPRHRCTSAVSGIADADVAALARLLAEDARAAILLTLSDGRQQTAGALARAAGLRASAATAHLSKLLRSGLLTAERVGRQRLYQIGDPAITSVLEAMAGFSGARQPRTHGEAYRGSLLRTARMCYDHLAGVLGVAITEALVVDGTLVEHDGGFTLSDTASARLNRIGVDLDEVRVAAQRTRRPIVRACLDWSERRPHLAGALGAAMATALLRANWLERCRDSRALKITNEGRRALRKQFGAIVL